MTTPKPTFGDAMNIDVLTAWVEEKVAGLPARIEVGTFIISVGTSEVQNTITWAPAFAEPPMVFCTIIDSAGTTGARRDWWGPFAGSTTGYGHTGGFGFSSIRMSGSGTIRVNWIAIGS